MKFPEKKIILFDLDGTLALSKSPITTEMRNAIAQLMKHIKVGVITGGNWEQCRKQVIDQLPEEAFNFMHQLYVLPTSGTRLRIHNGSWEEIYSELLSDNERKIIADALNVSIEGLYKTESVHGEIIEDRGSQITFSALGQQAPLHLKEKFDPDQKIRHVIVKKLINIIPEYDIRIGGSTSIDITKKGMDKGYGIQRLAKHLELELDEIGFVGDALFEGGNDYPAKRIGIHCVEVKNPNETEEYIRGWLKQNR